MQRGGDIADNGKPRIVLYCVKRSPLATANITSHLAWVNL